MTGAVLLAPRSARQAGIEKEAGRHLHLRCGIKAAFTGSDNRALHHDMPGVSERTCILYTSLVRQSREKGPNIGQVNPGLSSGGMGGYSKRTLMKEHPSKSLDRNQSLKTSKIASS